MTPDEKKAALDRLIVTCRELRDLEKKIRPFNVFDVLKSAHNEIRHSNVLAWLLDPDGSHGLQDLFLRRWLMLVFYGVQKPTGRLEPITIDSVPFQTVTVRREWRHIDVLLQIQTETKGRWVICIENKVQSTQGEDQLAKYYQDVESLFSHYDVRAYIFLTVTDEEPADGHWLGVTYKDVSAALEACLAEHSGSIGEGPRMLMNHYLSILKERFMDNNEITKLVAEIWANHEDALEIILENRPDNIRSVTEKLKELLRKEDFELLPTTAWGRVTFMPRSWASGQDRNNPAVLCDIKFTEKEESGRPLLRAYILSDRFDSGAELYKKLEKSNPRRSKESRKRRLFFQKLCDNDKLTVESLEAVDETKIEELANTLFQWVKARLSESNFKELEGIVADHLAKQGDAAVSSAIAEAGSNPILADQNVDPKESS